MAELVLSLSRFLAQPSFARSSDAMFTKALSTFYGNEKHTDSEWRGLVDVIKSRPIASRPLREVTPNVPRVPRRR